MIKSQKVIPVLGFHAIGESNTGYENIDNLHVSESDFEYYLKTLKERGYKTISFTDIFKFYNGEKDFDFKPILITFDDGYKSVLKAYEIMNNYDFTGNVFVISDYIGKKSNGFPWEMTAPPILDMLDEKDISSLLKNGWEIGSHTKSHKLLNKLTLHEIQDEIRYSKHKLKEIFNVEVISFAYPCGQYKSGINAEAVSIVSKFFKIGFSAEFGGFSKSSFPFLIERFIITPFFKKEDFIKIINRIELKENGLLVDYSFVKKYNIASELKKSRKFELSLFLFEYLLNQLPQDNNLYPKTLFHLGENYLFLGNKAKARDYFEKCISIMEHQKAKEYLKRS